MKSLLYSPVGLTATGSGPKIFKPMFLILLAGIVLGIFLPSVSTIPFYFNKVLNPLGWIWLVLGIVFWIYTIIQFLREFPKGKLITTGVYALSRNPLYASWIVFVLPGLALICNNWIFILSAIVMYFALIKFVKEEENDLQRIFRDQYIDYRKSVNRVFPFPKFVFRSEKNTK